MATSGTVGRTVIAVDKIIEHAVRRCKLNPAIQSNETLQIARDNLFLLMLSLANRGLNLWCVETNYIGLMANKATYDMPVGTIDVLNLMHSKPQRSEGTDTIGGTSFQTELSGATTIVRIGLLFDVISASDTVLIQSSEDGLVWDTVQSITKTDWAVDEWYWINLDPIVDAVFFRITTTNAITVNEFYLANSIADRYIDRFNRDDYLNLPNKQTLGIPTNYYYERKTNPRVTLWSVPNNNYDHLTLVRHRQIQDIGSYTNEVELPNRWLEAIIWQLAERLAFEIKDVDPAVLSIIQPMVVRTMTDVEVEETDGASIVLTPAIAGYNR